MLVQIEDKVLEDYPKVQVGYLVARVSVTSSSAFVDELKKSLPKRLLEKGISATNFTLHPNIALWRNIYEEDFHVKAKTYRSSVEALIKRLTTGKSLWNISNIVDLYNCVSVLSILPMGGYDLDKVAGNITVRYAKASEPFLGLGEKRPIEAKENHVVYADDKRLLCWLWNHKDSAETCLDKTTQNVIFFIDSFDLSEVETALDTLSDMLLQVGGTPAQKGVLSQKSPKADIKALQPG